MRAAFRMALISTLLALGSSVFADAEPAKIVIHRPYQSGDVYDSHITYQDTVNVTGAIQGKDQITKDTQNKAEITAHVSDGKHDANSESFTITIGHLYGSAGRDQIRPGSVVRIEYKNQKIYASPLDGRPIPDNAKKLLVLLYASVLKGPPAEAAEPANPPKVGDSWPLNGTVMAEQLTAKTVRIMPYNVSGKITLGALDDAGAHIKATVDIKDWSGDFLPAGLLLERSDLAASVQATYPGDTSKAPSEYEETIDVTATASTINSRAKVDVKMHAIRKETLTPVTQDTKAATATPANAAPAVTATALTAKP